MAAPIRNGASFRKTHPTPSTAATVAADAPTLADLLLEYPSESSDGAAPALIYTRSSPHWEEVRHVYNLNVATQPLAVVRPRSERGVACVVAYCVARGIPVSVRNGGHDFDGRNLVEGGVSIDMRALDWVEVAADRRTARVGGGAWGGTLLAFLESEGLVTPTGFCNMVGYAGWALGGGYGCQSPMYGLGVDQIVGGRIVTADGEVRDIEADEDLLFAVRGAGNGNLGVVTELKIKIHEAPKATLAGLIAYPWPEAETVLKAFRAMCDEHFPDNLGGDFLVVWVPGVGAVLLALYSWVEPDSDDLTEGQRYLEKMRSFGTVVLDTVKKTTPALFGQEVSANVVDAAPNNYRSRNVETFSDGVIEHLLEHPLFGPSGVIVIHNAHGAVLRANPGASFAARDPHLVFGISRPVLPEHNVDAAGLQRWDAWVSNLSDGLVEKGLAMDKGYGNFTCDADFDVVKFYGDDTTARLRLVKQRYDAANVFHRGYPRLA